MLRRGADMAWTQEGSAIVVVARRFNVTAAQLPWLVKQGIIDENDLREGALFSDTVVQAPTSRFMLLWLPDQLQFIPTVSPDEQQTLIIEKLGKIIDTLPHVPYKAVGLNFTWLFRPGDGDIARATRDMFYIPDKPLFNIFSGPNARFGGYLSKDYEEFRLKLNVLPTTVSQEAGEEHSIQFAFNFHRDVEGESAADISRCFTRWDELRSEAERIIQEMRRGIGT
jgi:hypothetical protein